MRDMASATFTIRVDSAMKRRLEKLARSTGRSRSWLAAEALSEYLDVNEWQIAGIRQAANSLERGEGVPHNGVKEWIDFWGSENERAPPVRLPKA